MSKKICVVGLGYIGLPTAGMFATHGAHVIGVDIREDVVEQLRRGEAHIQEPGLNMLVQAALFSGNFQVRMTPEHADIFIIAVPTPFLSDGEQVKHADLSYVCAAAKSIVACLAPGNLVILESTSPPGTTRDVVAPILAESGFEIGREIFLAYCPERVLPGQILEELMHNDRVVGGIDPISTQMAYEAYAMFVKGEILRTDATTAEMVKLMENTFRDVNIALANEFARVAETIGTDVWEAIRLANHHPRVKILTPGPGVGGHCIAVDPWFIAQAAPEMTPLIQTARRVNDAVPAHVAHQVLSGLKDLENPVVACLGLTYKADVDDTRESPAIEVVRELMAAGVTVRAYDPNTTQDTLTVQVNSLSEALAGADAAVILVGHRQFRALSPFQMSQLMSGRKIFDACNTVDLYPWRNAGLEVTQIGKGALRDGTMAG